MSEEPFTISRAYGWELLASNEETTYARAGRTNSNELRLSLARNVKGDKLHPPPQPVEMARALAERVGARVETSSQGVCGIGEYGRVVCSRKDIAYAESWVVTDGVHVFLATFSCDEPPTDEELSDVASMVKSVSWLRQ